MLIGRIVHWQRNWYSSNNLRLWCFREAAVLAVQVRVGSANRAFLRRSTRCTDGLSMIFFPRGVCEVRGHNHDLSEGRLTLLHHQPGLELKVFLIPLALKVCAVANVSGKKKLP